MSSKVDGYNKKQGFLSIISGTIVSIAITLVLILIFALIIRFFNIADGVIFPVNQVIKIVSLFVGAIVTLKKHRKNGFLKGILIGIVYFVLSYLIFGILQGSFSFNLSNLYGLLLTTLMGGLIGLIVINIVKK